MLAASDIRLIFYENRKYLLEINQRYLKKNFTGLVKVFTRSGGPAGYAGRTELRGLAGLDNCERDVSIGRYRGRVLSFR